MNMAHGSLSMDRIIVGICQHHDDLQNNIYLLDCFYGKNTVS